MERAGKLSTPERTAPYARKPSPLTVDGHLKPEDCGPVEDPAVLFGACAG